MLKKLTDELNKVANPENSQLGNQTLPAKEQQANVGLLVIYKTDQTTLIGE